MVRTLEETLKTAILCSGMSVNAIARESGVPQPSLWRFLNRRQDLALSSVQKLITHFGIKIEVPPQADK